MQLASESYMLLTHDHESMRLAIEEATPSHPETPGATYTDRGSVPTAERMAPATRGSRRSSEWAGHKDTIRRLYLEEGMSLSSVMEHMQLHHNFTAS